MRTTRLLLLLATVLFASAATADANSHPRELALSAWPARVVVAAPGRTTIGVGNPGDAPVRLVVRPRVYGLDALGRPRIGAGRTGWLAVRPERLVVAAHGSAQLHITVKRPRRARPGDHAQLVLLSTAAPAGRRVSAQLRLGVVVVARVRGRLVHRLGVARIAVRKGGRRSRLAVAVANRGNIDEWLARGRVSVVLVRGDRRIASAPIVARRLLARSSGIFDAIFRTRVHGHVTAVVTIQHPRKGMKFARWRYRLAL